MFLFFIASLEISIEFSHRPASMTHPVFFRIRHFSKSPVMAFRIEDRVITKPIKALLSFPYHAPYITGKSLVLTFRCSKCDAADKSCLSVSAAWQRLQRPQEFFHIVVV